MQQLLCTDIFLRLPPVLDITRKSNVLLMKKTPSQNPSLGQRPSVVERCVSLPGYGPKCQKVCLPSPVPQARLEPCNLVCKPKPRKLLSSPIKLIKPMHLEPSQILEHALLHCSLLLGLSFKAGVLRVVRLRINACFREGEWAFSNSGVKTTEDINRGLKTRSTGLTVLCDGI